MTAHENPGATPLSDRDDEARELAATAPPASADLRDRLRLILRGQCDPAEQPAA